MKCPHCGVDLQEWHVRQTTLERYGIDGNIVKEPVTIAIRKIEHEMTQAELEARNLD